MKRYYSAVVTEDNDGAFVTHDVAKKLRDALLAFVGVEDNRESLMEMCDVVRSFNGDAQDKVVALQALTVLLETI